LGLFIISFKISQLNRIHGRGGGLMPEYSSEALEMSRNTHMERHGCTSERLLLPGENAAHWEALLEDLMEEYGPETAADHQLVHEAARSVWVLNRNNLRYDEIEQTLYKEQSDSTLWTEEQWRRLELRTRYRTTAERSWMRAMRGLEHVRRNRVAEEVARARRGKLEAETKAIQRNAPAAEPKKERTAPEAAFELPKPEPHALHQRVVVTVMEGKTAVTGYPANEQITAMAEGVDERVQVIRRFEFPNGVPAEYEWTSGKMVWSTSLTRWRRLVEFENMRDAEVFLDPRIVPE
jgi:hypothetical protein